MKRKEIASSIMFKAMAEAAYTFANLGYSMRPTRQEGTMTPTTEQLREALVESGKHHEDGVKCTEKNYRLFNLNGDACALCGLFRKSGCNGCILNDTSHKGICCEEWVLSVTAKEDDDFPGFHKAEQALVARLQGELYKLNRGGEEIELGYSDLVAEKLKIREDEKAIWRFTGEYKDVKEGDVFLHKESNVVYYGYPHCDYPDKAILEFLRMACEPTKPELCESCKHEYEEKEAGKSKKLKYKVGDRPRWDGEAPGILKEPSAEVTIRAVLDNNRYLLYNGYTVNESSLSPLGYAIGDEIVMTHGLGGDSDAGKDWLGMKLKIVGFGNTSKEYEMFIGNNSLDSSGYPNGATYRHLKSSFIVRCIDPKFWTVEKDGVAYRAYQGKEDIWIYMSSENHTDKMWGSSILVSKLAKTLGIPIMPYGYISENYQFGYPEREDIR